jgi:c-di-GMP-binding flagellar brake protein YcgR
MSLRALVFCSDDKIVRVLRRVLSDLEISMEQCGSTDAALRLLTRHRFETVIVDCHDENTAGQVLRGVRAAPCNKHAIAVAILDNQKPVRSAFDLGAHFVLYKPLSAERAKTSFRAARALMKCERRRNTRIPVELPVALKIGESEQKTTSLDLSEGGMAIKFPRRAQKNGPLRVAFTLPGIETNIECAGEIAWENESLHAGIRFVDLPGEQRANLRAWLVKHSPEIEQEDPPVECRLTDLSLGGSYLEMASPFPVRTKVVLAMQIAELRVEVEGVVRVMHPETGMGVEFTRTTEAERAQVEKFIQALMNRSGATPELMVKPEGMEESETNSAHVGHDDPLLELFCKKEKLTTEDFLNELRKQRSPHSDETQAIAAV